MMIPGWGNNGPNVGSPTNPVLSSTQTPLSVQVSDEMKIWNMRNQNNSTWIKSLNVQNSG